MTFAPHTTRCPHRRNRAALALGAALGAAALGAWIGAGVRRLEVSGRSMEPALAAGDRVVVVRIRPRAGDVVAVRHPSEGGRVMLKRVASAGPGGLWLLGDNPGASTDSRHFGAVAPALVVGVAVYRYHPAERAGRLPRGGYHRPACR